MYDIAVRALKGNMLYGTALSTWVLTAMLNGLYRVGFQTQLGAGAGIAVLQDGVIRGGDSMMYYLGTFGVSPQREVRAEIVTGVHTKVPGMASVFGRDVAHVDLVGGISADGHIVQLSGYAREAPHSRFSATMTKLPEVDFRVGPSHNFLT